MIEVLEAEVVYPKHKYTLAKGVKWFYSLEELKQEIPFQKRAHAIFGINVDGKRIAVSWWVSPKRTRSYPYVRVYDTLVFNGQKATVIPFVKDEGATGDRDFIQWDTVSLMSLLGVYVILSFYVKAVPSTVWGKITKQRFDCKYLADRLQELAKTGMSAHEWNVQEIKRNLKFVARKAREGYRKIENETGVRLHGASGIDKAIDTISRGVEYYRDRSRILADQAQKREAVTLQPKENISITKKAVIIIRNQIGGYYPWTVDEMLRINDSVFLIEKKHSVRKRLPSLNDIKDGFLRLAVYNNILKLSDSKGEKLRSYACLGLTSDLGTGYCCNKIHKHTSNCTLNLNRNEAARLEKVFNEGTVNGITVLYLGYDASNLEDQILEKVLNISE